MSQSNCICFFFPRTEGKKVVSPFFVAVDTFLAKHVLLGVISFMYYLSWATRVK